MPSPALRQIDRAAFVHLDDSVMPSRAASGRLPA
jgi:hypothetical protein